MSSTSRPDPQPLIFFVDRSLGRKIIPQALRTANEIVKTHDELFPQNTPDEDWLAVAGRERWIVLTKDKAIRYHANETRALMDARVRAFVLTARGELTGAEMAAIFVKALPAIKRCATEHHTPFLAGVQKDGSVKIIWK